MAEVAIVQRALARNVLSPINLYDACRRASRRTRSKVAQAVCPDDELVDDFLLQVDESAADLLDYSSDVRTAVENRVGLRPDADFEKAREVLPPAIEEIANVSEADFAAEQIEDAKLIASEDVPRESKRDAIVRSGGRVLRAYQLCKNALKETSDISEYTAKIIKNSSIVFAAYQFLLMLF